MATNVEKSKTKEKKVGPAMVNLSIDNNKEMAIGSFSIMDNGEIERNPLVIGNVEEHECLYNKENNTAMRKLPDGTTVKADPNKFKQIVEDRKEKNIKKSDMSR